MAAGRWIGRGDKNAADKAAVDAMRVMLDTVEMTGAIVIGEGEKDEAPMLFNGEEVGSGHGPEVDVAVDPLEGTRLTALGMPNAITTIALAERGTMFFPGAAVYMDKIAAGPESAGAIDIEAKPADNVRAVAKAKGITPSEVSVVVLDRPRHEAADRRPPRGGGEGTADHGRRRRALDRRRPAGNRGRPPDGRRRHPGGSPRRGGAQVRRRGDPGEALAAERRGAPEPRRRRLRPRPGPPHGRPRRRPTTSSSPPPASRPEPSSAASATRGDGAITDSIVMRSRSGTVRRIEATHSFEKLEQISNLALPLDRPLPPSPTRARTCPARPPR